MPKIEGRSLKWGFTEIIYLGDETIVKNTPLSELIHAILGEMSEEGYTICSLVPKLQIKSARARATYRFFKWAIQLGPRADWTDLFGLGTKYILAVDQEKYKSEEHKNKTPSSNKLNPMSSIPQTFFRTSHVSVRSRNQRRRRRSLRCVLSQKKRSTANKKFVF